MIVVSVFLCVFYCSGLGIPYYGTQHIVAFKHVFMLQDS
jgi:hypothetical protein